MANRIVLISDDSNFFDYIKLKLELRKSDELFSFNFDEVPDKMDFLEDAVLIVNSENSQQKTLGLLNIFKDAPIIVVSYNVDDVFKKKCYRAGIIDYITVLTSDAEFRARMIPALSIAALIEKNRRYRNILVNNKMLASNNEVFKNFENVIDNTLKELNDFPRKAVFIAISPDDRGKFLLKSNTIETIILSNIRKNDILMNFAPNKYFLIMFDTNLNDSKKIWDKMVMQFPQKMYAGITEITNQSRQSLINSSLNKLHEAFNSSSTSVNIATVTHNDKITSIHDISAVSSNFKLYRKVFEQNLNQIVIPSFYKMQQKYLNKFVGVKIEQSFNDGCGEFIVTGKYFIDTFKITTPGFAKIIIDITVQGTAENNDSKRISFEPEEFDSDLLDDLLEQFLSEIKNKM